MTSPLFSVIIPVHNAEQTLEAALLSLQAQSVTDWEALIVNDTSNDKSAELLSAFAARDTRFRIFNDATQKLPMGPSRARNRGIFHAEGQYIAFLDADDRWYPEKLARQRDAFADGADIVFSAYRRVDPAGKDLGIVPAKAKVRWKDALCGNPIGCLTGAYRRARFAYAPMPDRPMHEDYAFWLGLLGEGSEAIGLPDVLAEYTVTPGSRSANKFKAAIAVWDILGEQKLRFWHRLWCFCTYARGAVRRRL